MMQEDFGLAVLDSGLAALVQVCEICRWTPLVVLASLGDTVCRVLMYPAQSQCPESLQL